MVDEMLAAAPRRFGDRILRLALGADEQHLAAGRRGLADEIERAREQRHGLRLVDDMSPVAVFENLGFHLWIPGKGMVAKMRYGLEQLLHADVGGHHSLSPSGSTSPAPRKPGLPRKT